MSGLSHRVLPQPCSSQTGQLDRPLPSCWPLVFFEQPTWVELGQVLYPAQSH